LGAFTVDGWLRQRDRTRAYLALSIVLLCGCGVAVAVSMLTSERAEMTSDLALTLFLASGWAFFGFRAAMTRLAPIATLAVSGVVLASIVLVSIAGISLTGAASTQQRLAVALLAAVWLGCVVEPSLKLWDLSTGMPRVQRARLRSITLAYTGVIVALLLSIGADLLFGKERAEITVAIPALAVTASVSPSRSIGRESSALSSLTMAMARWGAVTPEMTRANSSPP